MQDERMRAGVSRSSPRTPWRRGAAASGALGLLALFALGPARAGAETMPSPPPAPPPVSATLVTAPLPAAEAAAESLLARGELSLGRGEADLALNCFREAGREPGQRGRAFYGEARAWLALGQVDRACRLLRDLREARGASDTTAAGRELAAAAAGLLGRTYLQLGRHAAARGIFLDLVRSCPDRREWAAVEIARSYQNEAAWHEAFAAIRPILREGRYAPAYDLALALYWKLDAGAQRELTGLLRGYLGGAGRDFADGGR
jgi:tetratricopeptide (TPR) repeat protein